MDSESEEEENPLDEEEGRLSPAGSDGELQNPEEVKAECEAQFKCEKHHWC